MLRGVSYAFFVKSGLYITDAFGQEHRIHNVVSCHGADVRHTKQTTTCEHVLRHV